MFLKMLFISTRPDPELQELTKYLKELGGTIVVTEEELAARKDDIKVSC